MTPALKALVAAVLDKDLAAAVAAEVASKGQSQADDDALTAALQVQMLRCQRCLTQEVVATGFG